MNNWSWCSSGIKPWISHRAYMCKLVFRLLRPRINAPVLLRSPAQLHADWWLQLIFLSSSLQNVLNTQVHFLSDCLSLHIHSLNLGEFQCRGLSKSILSFHTVSWSDISRSMDTLASKVQLGDQLSLTTAGIPLWLKGTCDKCFMIKRTRKHYEYYSIHLWLQLSLW